MWIDEKTQNKNLSFAKMEKFGKKYFYVKLEKCKKTWSVYCVKLDSISFIRCVDVCFCMLSSNTLKCS